MQPTTWPIEFHANGELLTLGELTEKQIQLVTKMINTYIEVNKLSTEEK